MAEYFRAKESFAYGNEVVAAGQVWSSDHPAYKGRESLFEPIEDAATRASETATAAPGEVRSRSKRLGRPPRETSLTLDAKPEEPGTPAGKE